MEIREFNQSDARQLFSMIKEEGEEWEGYWGEANAEKYKAALNSSTVFVAYDGKEMCGYVRCRDDGGYGIHVLDLLVKKSKRGNHIGHMLIKKVESHFSGNPIYIHSDVDGYYQKQGYKRIGSIFTV